MADPTPEQLELYQSMAVAMMPRGIIWFDTTSGSEVKERAVRAMAKEPARLSEEFEAFLEAYMPDTCSGDGLAGWERILGLESVGLTEAERRAQVLTKLRGNSDPTLANVQKAADAWVGLNAVVTEHGADTEPFEMGISAMGDPLGSAWNAVLTITYNGPPNPAFEKAISSGIQYHVTVVFVVRAV